MDTVVPCVDVYYKVNAAFQTKTFAVTHTVCVCFKDMKSIPLHIIETYSNKCLKQNNQYWKIYGN